MKGLGQLIPRRDYGLRAGGLLGQRKKEPWSKRIPPGQGISQWGEVSMPLRKDKAVRGQGQGPWQNQKGAKGYALQQQSIIITVKIDVVKFPFPSQRVWSNTPWGIFHWEKGRTKVKSIGSKDLMVKPWS
jgi:hypothetical protein